MATFAPPDREGNRMEGPPGYPLNRLFRFYGSWAQGATVWKDSGGVWRESTTPYLGGAVHAVHDWDGSTYTVPDEGLATAQVVYEGGHVHTISEAAADELEAQGYTMLTRETISESFNKPDGDLGPDLSWERVLFFHDYPLRVVSNVCRMAGDSGAAVEAAAVPTPNVDSANVTFTIPVTGFSHTGSSGDFICDIGGIARFELIEGETSYRGYAFAIGRNNIFLPGVDTWHLAIVRADRGSPTSVFLNVALAAAAQVTLPGTLTFTANGSSLSASFTHGGPGATMVTSAVDTTYPAGAVAIGASTVVNGADTAHIDIDSWTVGPA